MVPLLFVAPGEQFLPIDGTNNQYFVSNQGRVYSAPGGSNVNRKGLILKPGKSGKGYPAVVLRRHERRPRRVHRLVAEHFIPNPESKSQVNHKNGIKTDNRVENLEWVTNSENRWHAAKFLPSRITDKVRDTARRLMARLTIERRLLTMEQAAEIRRQHFGRKDTARLAKVFGVGAHVIRRIVSGETYREAP